MLHSLMETKQNKSSTKKKKQINKNPTKQNQPENQEHLTRAKKTSEYTASNFWLLVITI